MTESVRRVDFSKRFLKQIKKSPTEIKVAFNERYEAFLEDPFRDILNNHQLVGRLKDYRSLNITGDWRALYSEYFDGKINVVVFEMLGTHSQLYR